MVKTREISVNLQALRVTSAADNKNNVHVSATCDSKYLYLLDSRYAIKHKEISSVSVKSEPSDGSLWIIGNQGGVQRTFVLTPNNPDDDDWLNFCQYVHSQHKKYHADQEHDVTSFLHDSSKKALGAHRRIQQQQPQSRYVKKPRTKRSAFGRNPKIAQRKNSFGGKVFSSSLRRPHLGESDEESSDDGGLFSHNKKRPRHVHEQEADKDDEEPPEMQEETPTIDESDALSKQQHAIVTNKRPRRRLTKQSDHGMEDDESEEDNIFDDKAFTTPAAQRVVSPGGTKSLEEPQPLQSSPSATPENKVKDQTYLDQFFEPKPSMPASTPPRSPAASRLIRSAQNKIHQKSFLQKRSPASAGKSSEEKRRRQVFGNLPSPVAKTLESSPTQRSDARDDSMEENVRGPKQPPPMRGRRRRSQYFDRHSQYYDRRSSFYSRPQIAADLTTDMVATTSSENTTAIVPTGPRFRGLRNLGNTCYINACLQMLCTASNFISSLRQATTEFDVERQQLVPLSKSIVTVETELADRTPPLLPVNPQSVKDAMDAKTNKYEGYEQRDAHEFLTDVIDYIHDELEAEEKVASEEPADKNEKKLKSENQNENGGKKDEDQGENVDEKRNEDHGDKIEKKGQPMPLHPTDDFRLTVQVCLQCISCGYKRQKEELYRHLSIDIVPDQAATRSDESSPTISKASVESSLSRFFQPEEREIKCEKCPDGTHAMQTLRVVSCPKFLLLHLKRFIFVEQPLIPPLGQSGDENCSPNDDGKPPQVEYVYRKNKAPVSLSESLSLDPFCVENDKESEASSENKTCSHYSLKSVVHHIGSRASSGHYLADVVRYVDEKDDISGAAMSSEENKDSEEEPRDPYKWVTFDDTISCVTSLTRITRNPKKQRTAYMLLYSLDDDALSSTIKV